MYPTRSGGTRRGGNEAYYVEADVRTQCGSCVRVLGACVKGVGGLAIIRSIPFGNAAMRISGEIMRASLGTEGGASILYGLLWEEMWESMFLEHDSL